MKIFYLVFLIANLYGLDMTPILLDSAYSDELQGGVVYLTDSEKSASKIIIKDGLLYNKEENLFMTGGAPNGVAIFIIDVDNNIYASLNSADLMFRHSCLSQGKPVLVAGHIGIEHGKVKYIDNISSQYPSTSKRTILIVLKILMDQGVDTFGIKKIYPKGGTND